MAASRSKKASAPSTKDEALRTLRAAWSAARADGDGDGERVLLALYLARANGLPLRAPKGLGAREWADRTILKAGGQREEKPRRKLVTLLMVAARDVEAADGVPGVWPAALAPELVAAVADRTIHASKKHEAAAVADRLEAVLSKRRLDHWFYGAHTSAAVAMLCAAGCTKKHARSVVYNNV